MKARITILAVVAILEAILIVVVSFHPRRVNIDVGLQAVTVKNPFFGAFQYEAPDEKFEILAKKFPNWISHREPLTGWSALAECAALRRTNVARILVANGANLGESLKEANKMHDDSTARFLQAIQEESGQRNSGKQ